MKRIFIFFLIASMAFSSGNVEIDDQGLKVLSPDSTQVIFLSGVGLGTFENLKDNSLAINTGVYTTSGKLLTTTAPVIGTLGFWTRTTGPAVLTTATAGDNIETTGTLTATTIGAYQAVGAIDFNSQNLTNVKLVDDFTWTGTLAELTANDSNKFVLLGTKMWSFANTLGNNIFTISSSIVASTPIFQATAGIKITEGEFIGTITDLDLMQFIDDLVTINGSLRSGHIGVGTAPTVGSGFLFSETNTTDTSVIGLNSAPVLDASISDGKSVFGASFSNSISGGAGDNDQVAQFGLFSTLLTGLLYDGTIDKVVFFEGAWGSNYGFSADITNMYGLKIDGLPTGFSGTVGDKYAVYLEAATGATTGDTWSIFSLGDDSFLTGDLAFGQTDKAERIGSDADGTLDLYAGTSIELHDATNIGDGTNETQYTSGGLLTMAGTARVLRSVDFEPDAVKKGGVGPTDSTEDGFPIHDYQATNDESVHIHWEIPHTYASGGEVHLHVEFFVDTAPGGAANVTWGVEYQKLSIGDNFDFGATTTVITNTALTTGTPANDQKIHSSAEIHLVTTGFEPMDVVLIRIFRDANASETDATDNFGSDARVFNYHLMFLSDKLGQGS